MSLSEDKKENTIASPAIGEHAVKNKKPYEKPDMRYERVFETMALSCGKTGPTVGSCVHNRNAS
jgi:hypothetical protein